MRPSVSFGSLAFSKICFAFSPALAGQLGVSCAAQSALPDKRPLEAPDFSNRPAYSAALAGDSGGTRMGPPPLTCGVMLVAGGCAKGPGTGTGTGTGGVGAGADGMDRPSNLGSVGAAVGGLGGQRAGSVAWGMGMGNGKWGMWNAQGYGACGAGRVSLLTLKGKLWRGIAACLVVADQAQDLAEAGRRQQAAVLGVGNLPYLAQHGGLQLGALEELDGDLAGDDAELLGVGLLEQVLEGALLFGGQVERRLWMRR